MKHHVLIGLGLLTASAQGAAQYDIGCKTCVREPTLSGTYLTCKPWTAYGAIREPHKVCIQGPTTRDSAGYISRTCDLMVRCKYGYSTLMRGAKMVSVRVNNCSTTKTYHPRLV